jgi:hypothetical protein
MAAEYQEPDWRVVNYQCFCLDESVIDRSTKRPLFVRGPRLETLEKGGYFVCLGAAHTFGRFCARPFPTILQDRIGLPVLNISHGGAGPAFFCGDNECLLRYLNDARFVVVQVMSGRSASNSLFESDGVGHFKCRSDGTYLGCDEAFTDLIKSQPKPLLARIVRETRQSWCTSFQQLLLDINAPKILFWFSTRTPQYAQGWRSLSDLFGAFPQLVNGQMVSQVRRYCDRYVECVSRTGLPQPLIDRFNGERTTIRDPWTAKPWVENWYYPSPQMHEEAADVLEPECSAFTGAKPAKAVSRSRWFLV